MTVIKLLDGLTAAGCELKVFGERLGVKGPVPDALRPHLLRLATGLRAKLTGKAWYGIDRHGKGTGPGRDGALRFDHELPKGTVRLAVGGDPDGSWDRVRPLSA